MSSYSSFSLTEDYAASVERVWRAWTEPEEMAVWFWGSMTKNAEASCDLRPNGHWRVYIDYAGDPQWPSGRIGMLGFFVTIVPHRELVYTVHWDANVVYNVGKTDCPDELIRARFEDVDDQCRVHYEHSGFRDDGHSIKGHRDGTLDVFRTLAGHLSSARR